MLAAHERPGANSAWPLGAAVTVGLLLCYLCGGLILLLEVGPWEAFRAAVVNGALVAAWLLLAHRILRHEPHRPLPPLRRPQLELGWALAVLVLTLVVASVGYYGKWLALPRWSVVLIIYAGVALLFLGLRYPPAAWGLRWPSRAGWRALGAVLLLNVAFGLVRAFCRRENSRQPLVPTCRNNWLALLRSSGSCFPSCSEPHCRRSCSCG